MMVKLKKLMIENQGYKRQISLKNLYINARSIISVSDYEQVENFLITEDSNFSGSKFSLVKVDYGDRTEDIIALGSAESIFQTLDLDSSQALLNG